MLTLPVLERFYVIADISKGRGNSETQPYQLLRLQMDDGSEIRAVGPNLDVSESETVWLWGGWAEDGQFRYVTSGKALTPSIKAAEQFFRVALKKVPDYVIKSMTRTLGAWSVSDLWLAGENSVVLQGLNESEKKAVVEGWRFSQPLRECLMYLAVNYRANWWKLKEFAEQYGNDAYELVEKNPYALVGDIGVSLKQVDWVVRKQYPKKKFREQKAEAAIHSELNKIGQQGHTAYPMASLLRRIVNSSDNPFTEQELINAAVNSSSIDLRVLEDKQSYIVFTDRFEEESFIYDWCIQKSQLKHSDYLDVATDRIKRTLPTITDEQLNAALSPLVCDLTQLAGGPGRGKSLTIRLAIEAFYCDPDNANKKVLLLAPTGKAAELLREVYDGIGPHRFLSEPTTIHDAVLNLQSESNQIPADYIITDESSMNDIEWTARLLKALKPNCKMMKVGDYGQLPSIGAGELFRDLYENEDIFTTKLTKVQRFGEGSGIAKLAKKFENSEPLKIHELSEFGDDISFCFCDKAIDVKEHLTNEIQKYLRQGFDTDDILVISPMQKGGLGVQELKYSVASQLNTHRQKRQSITFSNGLKLSPGDRVIHLKNEKHNKRIVNGSIGKVTALSKPRQCEVTFENGDVLHYTDNSINKLELAPVLTAHKSQGSQYKVVIMLATQREHKAMVQKRLIYTGITRSKVKLSYIGDLASLNKAITDNNTIRRITLGSVRNKAKHMPEPKVEAPDLQTKSEPMDKQFPSLEHENAPLNDQNQTTETPARKERVGNVIQLPAEFESEKEVPGKDLATQDSEPQNSDSSPGKDLVVNHAEEVADRPSSDTPEKGQTRPSFKNAF